MEHVTQAPSFQQLTHAIGWEILTNFNIARGRDWNTKKIRNLNTIAYITTFSV